MSAEHDVLLRITGLTKSFASARALDDVSFTVSAGEIVALVGHNGSGKSTLVKLLTGVHQRDAGEIDLADGVEVHVIHQDLGLAAEMSTVENLGLARQTQGLGGLLPVRPKNERAHARRLVSRFGPAFDVDLPVGRLSPAQRAVVAIARALDGWESPRQVLVLDEPTEALHAREVGALLDAVRALAAGGAGVVFISHRLDEVLRIADRVVVLRNGRIAADVPRAEVDHDALVRHITGATDSALSAPHRPPPQREIALQVEGLHGGTIEGIDLRVAAGEVLGIAGALGSGREAVSALLFGAARSSAARFEVTGRSVVRRSPAASIRLGMAYVPGDRGRYGAIAGMNARENVTLPDLRMVTRATGSIDVARERQHVRGLADRFAILPPRTDQPIERFSGGNQQKIVFARWLRRPVSVLLLEEPTQGVDTGAKQAIYAAIDAAAEAGAGIVVCSSEAKELVRLCDRVLVLRGGRIAAELTGDDLTETRVVLEGYGLADSGADTGDERR